jgi:hypothetical protein
VGVSVTMMMMMCGSSAVVRILEGGTSLRRDALLASALTQEVPPRE